MRSFLITLIKVISWAVFAVLMLIVIVFVGVFNFGFLEYGINYELNELVGKKTPLEVSIGSIEGDFFNTLLISDVSVRYATDSFSYPIAEIPSIRASYSLADIWRGKFDVNVLGIDSARFIIRQAANGEWLFPELQSKTPGSRTQLPSFSTNLLTINNATATLYGRDSTWGIDSLQLTAGIVSNDGALALDLRSFHFVTDYHQSRLKSASGKLTYSNKRLVFKDLAVDLARVAIGGDGWLSLPDSSNGNRFSGHLELDTLNLDMNYLGAFLNKDFTGQLALNGVMDIKDNGVSGRVNVAGDFQNRSFERLFARVNYADGTLRADTLTGTILGGCDVAGKLKLDFTDPDIGYTFSGMVDSLNVANLANGAMTTELTGAVTLNGSGLSSKNMSIHADVALGESFLDIFHVHGADGGVDIYTDSLRLKPGFAVRYYENAFSASGLIRYSGAIDVSGAAELNNLARFTGQTFITELAGRGQATYTLDGTVHDPNISGKFYSDSVWFYQMYAGRAWYDFDIKRFLTRRNGAVSAKLGSVSAWDFPLDDINAELRIDSNLIFIDSLNATSGDATMVTAATIDYLADPQPIRLYDVSLGFRNNVYHELDTTLLLFDTTGIEFKQAEFVSPHSEISPLTESFSIRGRAGFDRNLGFNLNLENIDITPWTKLFAPNSSLSGRVSLAGDVTVNIDTLKFDASGRVDSLVYQDLYIGNIVTDFRYVNKLLTIDTLDLRTAGGAHILRGTVPLDIRFGSLADTLFPGEQRLQLHSTESQYDFVSHFLPQVEALTGALEVDAIVSGTPRRPAFNGSGQLSNGTLKIYELEIPAESLYVDFQMQDRLVTITQGACRFPPTVRKNGKHKKYKADKYGYVNIEKGTLEILSIDSIDYNVSLNATNFPFEYTLGAIKGKANARLKVTGVTPPKITGDLDLISALYEDEFLEEDAGYLLLTQFERPDSWDMDVNVTVVSNAVVRNSELDAEFKGTARAIRTDGLWSYLYNLEVIRGRVFLTTNSFRLDPGGTVINDDVAVNNPQLNLIARTKVRVPNPSAPGEQSSGTRQAEAAIRVTGTLEEPIITYYDDPAISDNDKINEDQLYTLLAFGYQVGQTDQNQTALLGSRGAEMLANYLSSNLTRAGARSIGVETFEVDPNVDVEQTEVTLGLYVLPGLYTYGKSDIAATGQEVGFEYYLGRHLLIQGKRDENDHYFLFLNLGWDY